MKRGDDGGVVSALNNYYSCYAIIHSFIVIYIYISYIM